MGDGGSFLPDVSDIFVRSSALVAWSRSIISSLSNCRTGGRAPAAEQRSPSAADGGGKPQSFLMSWKFPVGFGSPWSAAATARWLHHASRLPRRAAMAAAAAAAAAPSCSAPAAKEGGPAGSRAGGTAGGASHGAVSASRSCKRLCKQASVALRWLTSAVWLRCAGQSFSGEGGGSDSCLSAAPGCASEAPLLLLPAARQQEDLPGLALQHVRDNSCGQGSARLQRRQGFMARLHIINDLTDLMSCVGSRMHHQ